MLTEMDASTPPAEQKYHALMDEAATMHRNLSQQGERLQQVEERLTNLEARLVGTDFINSAQVRQYQEMIAILGDLLKKKGSGNHATVHAEVHAEVQSLGINSQTGMGNVLKHVNRGIF